MATENMEASEGARAIDSSEGTSNYKVATEASSQKVSPRENSITSTEPPNPKIENDQVDETASLPVTHALEALLGGLGPAEEASMAIDTPSREPDSAQLSATQGNDALSSNDNIQDVLHAPGITDFEKSAVSPPVEERISSMAVSQESESEGPVPSSTRANHAETPRSIIPGLGLWNDGSKPGAQVTQETVDQQGAVAQHEDVQMIGTKEPFTDGNTAQAPIESVAGQIAAAQEADAQMVDTNKPHIAKPLENASEVEEIVGAPASITELATETVPENNSEIQQVAGILVDAENGEEGQPEWEIDSSPIESSSDDSSSDDSSSDESEEGDNAYKLLSPEEQARILMKGDGDSDDEGAGRAKGSGGPLRTKNEVPEVVIPKPEVVITENMPITELGVVEQIVDNILLIKANVSGEYKVLESGSVLCLADRNVIGVVAETIGRVQQPFYSVLFTNIGELQAAGLSTGVQIYYSEQHSTFVFTQALKAFKGSDASNLHDEEVGDEEMEFSDDEAEAEHKRRVKQKRMERRGGKSQQNNSSNRGSHPLQQQHGPYDAAQGINYDDNDDGLYTPLARPASYATTVGRSEAPQESPYSGHQSNNRDQNRDNFRGRGRGDRGRGRGDRGRGWGRGGHQDRRSSSGFSLPPQSQISPSFQASPSPGAFTQPMFQPQNFVQPSPNPSATMPLPASYNSPPTQQYSPNQPHMPAWPQFQPPNYQQNQYQAQANVQNNWQNVPPPPPGLPAGVFINPAFFNQNNQPGNSNQWNQQNQRGGRNDRGSN